MPVNEVADEYGVAREDVLADLSYAARVGKQARRMLLRLSRRVPNISIFGVLITSPDRRRSPSRCRAWNSLPGCLERRPGAAGRWRASIGKVYRTTEDRLRVGYLLDSRWFGMKFNQGDRTKEKTLDALIDAFIDEHPETLAQLTDAERDLVTRLTGRAGAI